MARARQALPRPAKRSDVSVIERSVSVTFCFSYRLSLRVDQKAPSLSKITISRAGHHRCSLGNNPKNALSLPGRKARLSIANSLRSLAPGWRFAKDVLAATPTVGRIDGARGAPYDRSWGHLKVCAPNNANSDKERTSDHATSLRRLLAVLRGRNPSTAMAACSHR